MRPLLFSIVCLALASSVPAETPQPAKGGIAWEASYDQAKTKAAGEGKLLFVEFLTDG